MEPQILIDATLAAAMAVGGWFGRELWGAVKELKVDIAGLKEGLPKTYVMRDDYREDVREIKQMLGKIFDKLDAKVDK